jgi:hypothetical protein
LLNKPPTPPKKPKHLNTSGKTYSEGQREYPLAFVILIR